MIGFVSHSLWAFLFVSIYLYDCYTPYSSMMHSIVFNCAYVDLYSFHCMIELEYDNIRLPKIWLSLTSIDIISPKATMII